MNRVAAIAAAFLALTAFAAGADSTRQSKLAIAPGGVINVVNNTGSVTLHQGQPQQVTVNAVTHSNKVEVDTNDTPDSKRVDIRTHDLTQQTSGDECRVDYDITVPAGVSVTINTATAPITVENLSGDLSLSSDTGLVTVRNAANSHLQIRGVAAPVALFDVSGHVDVTSSRGSVKLTNVVGPKITVSTASGDISYQGDFAGGGFYLFTTHNGSIDVTLPANASIDLTASSVKGSVENDYPLQTKTHMTFVPTQGRSFAGTSNSGSSAVELQSFSGRIRVKKQ